MTKVARSIAGQIPSSVLRLVLFYFSVTLSLLSHAGSAVAQNELTYEQVWQERKSSFEATADRHYQGRTLDYGAEISQFLVDNLNQMSAWETTESLRKIFELCFAAANYDCMSEATILMEFSVEALSNDPNTVFGLSQIYQAELEYMLRLVNFTTHQDYLNAPYLFEGAVKDPSTKAFMVDQKTVALDHIARARAYRSIQKNSPEELEAGYFKAYEHLFYALSIILSASTYDPHNYRSSLRALITIIGEFTFLGNRRTALFIAQRIEGVVREHFPKNSYERATFELFRIALMLETGEHISADDLTELERLQTSLDEMQWFDESLAQGNKLLAKTLLMRACGSLNRGNCFQKALDELLATVNEYELPAVFFLQSLQEHSQFIDRTDSLEIQAVLERSRKLLGESETSPQARLGVVQDDGDLFEQSAFFGYASDQAGIDAAVFAALRLSFREQVLPSHQRAKLVDFISRGTSQNRDDYLILANELLLHGKFSNLSYSVYQSHSNKLEANNDLVKDFLKLTKQSYAFLATAIDRYKNLPLQPPVTELAWNVDWDWLKAFIAYYDQLRQLESRLNGLNSEMVNRLATENIQANLEEDEAIVYSVLHGELLASTCINSREVVTASTALDKRDFDLQLRLLDMSLSSTHSPSEDQDKRFPISSAYSLYQSIFGGIEECTAAVDHVFWIPTDNLDQIPVSALVTSRSSLLEAEAAESGLGVLPWLAKQFSYSVLKSAVEIFSPQIQTTSDRLLAIGDPSVAGPDTSADALASITRGLTSAKISIEDLASLPNTASEINSIANLFKGTSEVLLSERATERNVRAALASAPDLLTFATHGLVSGELEDLNESALLLTPGSQSNDPMDDGLLTASEISDLQLNTKFVSLSACNTAIYEPSLFADQIGGLTAAFQLAGARSVLGTLWPVETNSAELINTSLYAAQSFLDGDFASSLREAQQSLLDGDHGVAFQHPRFWAAYTLYGARRNAIKPDLQSAPTLRRESEGSVLEIFETAYSNDLAVAVRENNENFSGVSYGLLDTKTLEIKDSMQAGPEFGFLTAGPIGEKFLGIGTFYGKIEDQATLWADWGEDWKNAETHTGYMELYDRGEDHGTYIETPVPAHKNWIGAGHVSRDGIGSSVYQGVLPGDPNVVTIWKPDQYWTWGVLPSDPNQYSLSIYTGGNVTYVARTQSHAPMVNSYEELDASGMTNYCGHTASTSIFKIEHDLSSSEWEPMDPKLVASIPNFGVRTIEEWQGKIILGGAHKFDCRMDTKASWGTLVDGEYEPVFTSEMPGSFIRKFLVKGEELLIIENYQSESGIPQAYIPQDLAQEWSGSAAFPISYERYRRARSRLMAVSSQGDSQVVATVSAGGDAVMVAAEKTDEAIFVAGSAAGTPFLSRIPTRQHESRP